MKATSGTSGHRSRRALCVGGMFLLVTAASCEEGPPPPAKTFVAFERDFQGFRNWENFPVDDAAGVEGAHSAGPRRVYLKERPPTRSTSWPVGTIIVKEEETVPDLNARPIFAMVKRGGDFNPDGDSWEWFGLNTRVGEVSERIVWRGVGPPGFGSTYGVSTFCNPCHKSSGTNDMVQSSVLDLSRF